MSYLRFGLMILTSTIVMFILMYLNTYAWEHVFYSETRAYMAILMGASMAVVMLAFMLGMYADRRLNTAIFACAVVVFGLSLWLVRSQATVSGISYMRAMIPHHSIAVMTSGRARIEDARVRKLADEIIAAQRKEIAEMRWLIADVSAGNVESQTYTDPSAQPGSVEDALNNTLISRLDLDPLAAEEAAQVLDGNAECRFNTSPETDPILWLAANGAGGAVKLNGVLIGLEQGAADGTLSAEGMSVSVQRLGADADWRSDAVLTFTLDEGMRAGYHGFLSCDG